MEMEGRRHGEQVAGGVFADNGRQARANAAFPSCQLHVGCRLPGVEQDRPPLGRIGRGDNHSESGAGQMTGIGSKASQGLERQSVLDGDEIARVACSWTTEPDGRRSEWRGRLLPTGARRQTIRTARLRPNCLGYIHEGLRSTEQESGTRPNGCGGRTEIDATPNPSFPLGDGWTIRG